MPIKMMVRTATGGDPAAYPAQLVMIGTPYGRGLDSAL